MTHRRMWGFVVVTALATGLGSSALSAQDKYTVKVPGGLAFSEFKGYESWEFISLSEANGVVAAIFGNPTMIDAYKKGYPGNGKPIPDGARMAKVHWNPTKNQQAPGNPTVAGTLHDVDFMVKDSKRFASSGGWGYAAFNYDNATSTFKPATAKDAPPQNNDATCGFACNKLVKSRDYVFTNYAPR